ncbi:hypothetical protein CMK10_16245 [Candidatus Poribacteria bacterium]|nr:hypothetical protein [Candidatus Poribacteria bacterium]
MVLLNLLRPKLALGMIPTILYESITVDLESDDLLLLMTNGITEPRNIERGTSRYPS